MAVSEAEESDKKESSYEDDRYQWDSRADLHFGCASPIRVRRGGSTITVGLKTKVPQFGGVAGHYHRQAMDTVRDAVAAG